MEIARRPSDRSALSDDGHGLATPLGQGLIVVGRWLVAQLVPLRIVAEEEEEEGDEGDEEEYRLSNVG